MAGSGLVIRDASTPTAISRCGRIKEMINRGGEKFSPREIDETLLAHPAVAEAAASATAGCASNVSSISRGENFSPPRLINSLIRADQREIAVRVEASLIAGPEPAVDEGRGVGLRIVLVAADHVEPRMTTSPRSPGRQMPAVLVHDADLDVRAAADRARFPRRRRQRIGRQLMRGFGHAVASRTGAPNAVSSARITRGGSDALHERMKRSLSVPAGRRRSIAARASSSWWSVGTAENHVMPNPGPRARTTAD